MERGELRWKLNFFNFNELKINDWLTLWWLPSKFLKNKKYRVLEKDIPVESLMNFDVSFKVNSIQGLVFIDQIENNKFSKNQIIYNILKDFIY